MRPSGPSSSRFVRPDGPCSSPASARSLVTFLATHGALHQPGQWYRGFDPTNQSLAGLALGSLAWASSASWPSAASTASGTIRSSLAAMPRRGVCFGGQGGRGGARHPGRRRSAELRVVLRGTGGPLAAAHPRPPSGSPVCCGRSPSSGAFLALFALLGLGLGTIIRHTAGAIAVFAGVTLLAPDPLPPCPGHPAVSRPR